MIDQERVREMTRMAAFEASEGKQYKKINRFYRSDFAGRHLMKAFFAGTFVYLLLLVMWVVNNFTELMEHLDTMDYIQFGTTILARYLLFLLVYLIIVDIYANVLYARSQRKTKRFYRWLKRLGRLYEDQENRTAPDYREEEE